MFNAGVKKKKKKVDNRRTPTALKEYQVKELMKKRELNSRIQYLVRWESYEDDKFDTWLYEEHISQSAINGYAEGKSFTKMRASIVAGRHPSDPAYQNHLCRKVSLPSVDAHSCVVVVCRSATSNYRSSLLLLAPPLIVHLTLKV